MELNLHIAKTKFKEQISICCRCPSTSPFKNIATKYVHTWKVMSQVNMYGYDPL